MFKANASCPFLFIHLGVARACLGQQVVRLLVRPRGVLAQRPVHQEEGDAGVLFLRGRGIGMIDSGTIEFLLKHIHTNTGSQLTHREHVGEPVRVGDGLEDAEAVVLL